MSLPQLHVMRRSSIPRPIHGTPAPYLRVELCDLLDRDIAVAIREDVCLASGRRSRTIWSRCSYGASAGREPAPTQPRCHCQDRDTDSRQGIEDYAADWVTRDAASARPRGTSPERD